MGSRTLHALLLGAFGAGAVVAAPPTEAAGKRPAPVQTAQVAAAQRFDLPAQPLIPALIRFSEITGLQLFFDATMARGLRSPGVSGTMAPERALVRLLAGTGLTYSFTNATTITLERPPPAGTDALQLAPVHVEARTPAPSTAVTGNLAPAYPGGQVARGGGVGLLGNRDILDTPFNVTHYTAKAIEDQQAHTLADVLMNDPSVRSSYARGSSLDEFNIRGFTLYNREVSFNGLQGIAPYSNIGLEGIERVEVLKGPNALLNGMAMSGSIGGGINLVPKRAGDEPLTRLTTSYVSDGQLGTHVDVGGRFGPDGSLGVRFNGAFRGGAAAIEKSAQDQGIATLGLDYRGERVRLEADFSYQKRNHNAPSGQLLFPGTVVPAVPPPGDTRRNFFQPWTYWDTEDTLGMVRGEFDVTRDITLFAALGARHSEFDSLQTNWTLQDAAGTVRSSPFYSKNYYETLTGEAGVRARAETGFVRHQVSLSASFFHQEIGGPNTSVGTLIFSNIYNPIAQPRPVIPSFDGMPKTNEQRMVSVALADTLSILDDRVQLTVGLRHQQLEVENFNGTTGVRTSAYDEAKVTPAVGLVVKPLENLALYANYIEGLSQGPTAPSSAVNAGEVFPPFVSKQYEAGVKLDLGGFATTLSVFQISQPNGFTDPVTMRYGVDGRQRNRGVELMTFGEVVPEVRVLGGVAYTQAKLAQTAGGINDGNGGIGAPEWQFNLGSEWDVPFLPGLTLQARAIYTDSQYINAANTQRIPDWVRIDVGARYAFELGSTPVTIRANVENLFDNDYWASAPRGGYKAGAPRTFLLSTAFDF